MKQANLDVLAARALSCNQTALNDFFCQVLVYLHSLLEGNPYLDLHQREDLVQDLVTKLMELFRSSPQRLPSEGWCVWLKTVVRNCLIDKQRQCRRRLDKFLLASEKAKTLAAQTSTPSVKFIRKEDNLRLANAIALLPEKLREVAQLRFIEQLGVGEIAERLKKSTQCVSVVAKRARTRLVEILASTQ